MKKIRNILLIISVFVFTFMTINTTIAYLVTEASPLSSIFVTNVKNGNLSITSSVNHNLGNDYVIPEDIKLNYQIDLGINYANIEIVTTEGVFNTDENGLFNISIKPNNNVIIYDISAGTEVKVTQLNTTPGFEIVNPTITKVMSDSEISDIIFESEYKPLPAVVENFTISGEKILEGREWKENDSFTFKLEVQVGSEWIELGRDTITYNSEDTDFAKFDLSEYINDLEIPVAAKVKFRMTEVVGDNSTTDCDGSSNYIYIIVGDETMDGKLEVQKVEVAGNITLTETDGKYKVEVSFNNANTNDLIYVDEPKDSFIEEELIIVRNHDYEIETVINNFEGLSDDYTYKVFDKDGNELESTLVRTGDYVEIVSNDKTYKFYMVLKGDVNGDGGIAPIDYVKIKNHIMGDNSLDGKVYELAADYNDDENISPLDYVKVKNHIMNGGN